MKFAVGLAFVALITSAGTRFQRLIAVACEN
jgi:hypothetical protein